MAENWTHLFVFEEKEPQITEFLRSYAETSGFRKIDLDVKQISWLMKLMRPNNGTAYHNYCRLYIPLTSPSGRTCFFPFHRRGFPYSKGNEELLQISTLSDRDIFYFWNEQGSADEGGNRGYEIYSNGKLKKSVVVARGCEGLAVLELDGKIMGWPGEVREKLKLGERIVQPPLGDEFYQDQGFSPALIKWADETFGAESLEQCIGAMFFLSKGFSEFSDYAKYLDRYSRKKQVMDVFVALLFSLVVLFGLAFLLRACF